MKILQIIHGYPMLYNAGSEVYTQTLCHGLASSNEVFVFTREEDPFKKDANLIVTSDGTDNRIKLYLINNPRNRDRYRVPEIDKVFIRVLDEVKPDIIHIGHMNHLSTSLVYEAAIRGYPIIFTLHDFWLMCPRGQFMQMFPQDKTDLWKACKGQDDRKCAERCYARYFSGSTIDCEEDIEYWSSWVARRMKHIHEMIEHIDLFIAPSKYLLNRHISEFGIPSSKLVYLDYGFDHNRLMSRERMNSEPFTFGYIGTHIPAKGIQVLLDAFGKLAGETRLRIWGKPRDQATDGLKRLAERLPAANYDQIKWHSEYQNQNIVRDVFNHVDAIVVPSIWTENSPLVIHEAQQARIPVITSDIGGMAEYVRHEANGLLFRYRNSLSLSEQMQRFIDDPALAKRLGERGYLYSETGNVPHIQEHVELINHHYQQVITNRKTSKTEHRSGPWRITFDTNPDTCNLHCIMCEQHSTYRKHNFNQINRHRIMPFDMIERVVKETVPNGLREIIPSTMGEPLLYPDIERIIELCREYNLKLNLTTNGTFPKHSAATWAEEIIPISSDVKISMNGASRKTQEAIMEGSNLENTLNNIQTFCSIRDELKINGTNGCRVTLQLTFLERNMHEITDLVKMAIDMGVDRVKGHHVWTHYPELEQQSLRRSPEVIKKWNDVVRESARIVKSKFLPNGKRLILDNFNTLEKSATDDIHQGGRCPFLGHEAWINTEGRFDPCCAPDDLRRGLGSFGNICNESFMDIWRSEAYKNLIRTYPTRSLCISCNLRKPAEE